MDEITQEKVFKAFANRRRLAIIKIIKKRKKISVGNLADAIKLSFRSTSKHLGILYSAGIVDREQISLTIYYSLATDLSKLPKQILDLV